MDEMVRRMTDHFKRLPSENRKNLWEHRHMKIACGADWMIWFYQTDGVIAGG